MIHVCENFADKYDVTFNTGRPLFICYGSHNNATLHQVSLNGANNSQTPW